MSCSQVETMRGQLSIAGDDYILWSRVRQLTRFITTRKFVEAHRLWSLSGSFSSMLLFGERLATVLGWVSQPVGISSEGNMACRFDIACLRKGYSA